MKLFLAACLAVCFVAVHCDTAPKPEEKAYVKECAKSNNMDDKMVMDLKQSKSLMMNDSTMCFVHCLMKHNDLMDDAGKVMEKMSKMPHAADCQNMTGKNKCETAAKIMDCILNKEGVPLSDLNL